MCMCMKNDLLKSKLINLLKEDCSCEKDLQNAYNQLVMKIHKLIENPSKDCVYFLLKHLKIEIEALDVKEKKTLNFSSGKH